MRVETPQTEARERRLPSAPPVVQQSENETLAEARRWQVELDKALDQGFCRPCAVQTAYGMQMGLHDLGPLCKTCEHKLNPQQPSLRQLIRHLSLYYSDHGIVHDLDCVLLGLDEGMAERVEAYARARRRAAGFNPRLVRRWLPAHNKYLMCAESNNHHKIDAATLAAVMREPKTAARITCQQCGATFASARRSAKYCSDDCKRLSDRKGAKRLRAAEPKDRVATHA